VCTLTNTHRLSPPDFMPPTHPHILIYITHILRIKLRNQRHTTPDPMTGFVLGPKRQLQRHDEIGGMARRRQLPGTEASKQVEQVKQVTRTRDTSIQKRQKNVRKKCQKKVSLHHPHIHTSTTQSTTQSTTNSYRVVVL
jgi:hypothetical protein